MRFTKMHGAGNDYVYVDCFNQPAPSDPEQLAQAISDRHFGVGGDGLILITPHESADAEMRMYNADGSYSEMCGNGVRCVAKYVFEHGICEREEMRIASADKVLALRLDVDKGRVGGVRVDMGEPVLQGNLVPTLLPPTTPDGRVIDAPLGVGASVMAVTAVSMGNPHCVVYVQEATNDLVHRIGPHIEVHPAFPKRVNVEFVEVLTPGRVKQRTWERGAGETMACGTGACAVCVAGVLTGRTERRLTVELLGGELELEWNEQDNHVYMTGPAEEVFSGEWPG